MSTNPKYKAGVGLYSPVPSTYVCTSTGLPANTSFRLTESHAKGAGFSAVEAQWSVQPRSRRDEAGMPATGSRALITACTPPSGKELQITPQATPSAAVPQSRTAPLLTLTKVAHFPLVWVNRNSSQSIRNNLFQILVAGALLSYGEQQFQMKDTISGVSFPHNMPSSTGHTPITACWYSASFKCAFISHTRLST